MLTTAVRSRNCCTLASFELRDGREVQILCLGGPGVLASHSCVLGVENVVLFFEISERRDGHEFCVCVRVCTCVYLMELQQVT